ncbi:MAG: glycosyl hydrolase-related protein [Bacillota bacterium]
MGKETKKTYKAHIVSHSHWDREWYFSLEEYRILLVDMIDRLMALLEADDDYRAFMLDGHTALVEDYLAIKPQNEERLAEHIRAGRILIGPWYVLPDQMLISGEAHVRNYLFGERICRRYGQNMNLGYAPDAFGHPSQLPQIYRKLGLGEILFWRGLTGEIASNEFIWQAPDGSEILGNNLAYGYGNCPNMPAEPKAFLDRVDYVVKHYALRSKSNVMLVMNGRDHLEAQPHIAAMAKAADALSADTEVLHSTLTDYMADLRASLDVSSLPRYKGALYDWGRVALLQGTLSTRMVLKQLNQAVEDLYEHWAEPFSSVGQIEGVSEYPRDLIRHGWRFILQNHPHDSITGCGVDEVHREMMTRFASARQIGETLTDRALRSVAGKGAEPAKDCYISVFNPSPYGRTQAVDCAVEFNLRLSNALIYERMRREQYDDTGADLPLPTSVALEDPEGNRIPGVLKSARIGKVMRYYTYTQPHEFYAHICKVSFVAADVPALGYRAYKVIFGYDEIGESFPKAAESSIENSHFKVEYTRGKIDILAKDTGRRFYDCGALRDEGDAGDEYLFREAKGAVARMDPTAAQVSISRDEVRQSLRLKGVLSLPCGLSDDGESRSCEEVSCPVEIEISISDAEPRVDFKTTFENRANNHRLRAAFQTDVQTDRYDCENIFCVDGHDIAKGGETVVTRSQKRFVSVGDTARGVTVANKGLPEVEVKKTERGALMLVTLLRSVGIMANGPTGLNIPTPEAQCIGKHIFEYSFIPHRGDWLNSRAFRLVHAFCEPMRALQSEDGKKPGRPEASWLSIDAPELVLSAFKQAETLDNTFVLRFYNTCGQPVNAAVTLGFDVASAYLMDLRERKMEELPVAHNAVTVQVGPWEIVTLGLYAKHQA